MSEDLSIESTLVKTDSTSVRTEWKNRSPILYLTFDGVMEPLGRSQVLRYLCGLSERGFSYKLISLERKHDLADTETLVETEELLRRCSVEWVRLPYCTGGPGAVLRNIRAMAQSAQRLLRAHEIGLVHARAHVPALIAWYLRLRCGTPYLFDARGYWIDEKVAEGQWFTHSWIYAIAKWLERRIFQSAGAVVTLTDIMADDLRAGVLERKVGMPIAVIPTCADFDHFAPDSCSPSIVPLELRMRLEAKLVVGLIGAVNVSYCFREGLVLFRLLKKQRADAHLLCITQQGEQVRALVREAGITDCDYTITQSRYEEMPDWMRLMDWGLLLLNETFAKRGSMPTKLAEMLACGVRPIQYGCNQEVTEAVRKMGSGVVLTGLSLADLTRGVEEIVTKPLTSKDVDQARQNARACFGVEIGINKYESLLGQLLVSNKS